MRQVLRFPTRGASATEWAWLILPAVAATMLLGVVAGRAFYISPDSVSYVGTARNLVDGHGLTPPPGAAPLGHFPPLFTLVLAAVGALGPDPLSVARWLNPVLLGATLVLVAVMVRSTTGSAVAGGIAAVAIGAGYDVLAYHSSALSEPLFVVLVLAALAALTSHIRRPRPWMPAAAGGLAGAAVLTRYAGAALVMAGVLSLVWWGRRRRPAHGGVDAALFAGVALVPTVAWLAWAHHAAGRATGRQVMYHPFERQYFERGARVASEWLLPRWVSPGWRMGGAALMLAGLALAAVLARRRHPEQPSDPPDSGDADSGDANSADAAGDSPFWPLPWLLSAFALSYLAVLVLDRMLLDVTGHLEPRLLVPLHVVAVVLVVPIVHRLVTNGHSRAVSAAVLAVAVAVLGLQVRQAGSWSSEVIRDGAEARGGFSAPAWRQSEAIAQVRRLAPGTPVYSNAADAIYFVTGRAAQPVPARRTYLTGHLRAAYEGEMERVRDDFENRGAVLVWFDSFTARTGFLPSRQELTARLGLVPGPADRVSSTYVRERHT